MCYYRHGLNSIQTHPATKEAALLATVELQRQALDTPVEQRFIYQTQHVKGPYTTGDYVRWKLNQIFGPDNWNHLLIKGPDLIPVNDRNAYVQVTVRLKVRFSNGRQVTHDDVGIWPFQATRGSDLDGTMPERYETVLKAAITDGIKACSEYLGLCFRPLGDETLDRHIRKVKRSPMDKNPQPSDNASLGPKAITTFNKDTPLGPTDFWSRFNELELAGRISPDIRDKPKIKESQNSGDWIGLLQWLENQVS
jgi:hypothetical protein